MISQSDASDDCTHFSTRPGTCAESCDDATTTHETPPRAQAPPPCGATGQDSPLPQDHHTEYPASASLDALLPCTSAAALAPSPGGVQLSGWLSYPGPLAQPSGTPHGLHPEDSGPFAGELHEEIEQAIAEQQEDET